MNICWSDVVDRKSHNSVGLICLVVVANSTEEKLPVVAYFFVDSNYLLLPLDSYVESGLIGLVCPRDVNIDGVFALLCFGIYY